VSVTGQAETTVVNCDETPPHTAPIPGAVCTPQDEVPLTSEAHLIYASSSGLLRVTIDCSVSSELVGFATELGGRRARAFVFYNPTSGWTFSWANSSSCLPFAPYVVRRLQGLCKHGEASAPLCLIGAGTVDAEPVLHRLNSQPVSLDYNCVLARHHYYFGNHFLPRGSECPVPSASPRGHMRKLGEQGQPTTPIAEHAGCLGVRSFLKRYVFEHRPLVVRGCAREQPAFTKWDDMYLSRVAGEWPFAAEGPSSTLRFAQYLNEYKRPNDPQQWMQRSWWHAPESLRRDVEFPPMLRCGAVMQSIENLVVWLSAGGKSSQLHYDAGDFLIHQLEGRKRVTLIDPVDSVMLYADHVELYGTTPVEPTAVDLHRFPSIAQLPLQTATLSAGDVLYIPQNWWHIIDTEAGDTRRNLAFSLQFNFPSIPNVDATGSHQSHELTRAAIRRRSLEAMPPQLRACGGQAHDKVAGTVTVEDIVGQRQGGWHGSYSL